MTTNGTTLINQLSSIERCIAANKECCSNLLSEIKRIEAKVDAIPKVDEQDLIKKAVAAVFSNPEWLIGGVAAIGAIRSSNLQALKEITKTAGRVNVLGNSLDSLRSGFTQLGERVSNVSNVANNAKVATDSLGRTVLDNSRQLNFMQKDVAQLFGKAGQFANFAASVIGAVGSIAGLASLAGILLVVFPRLDAHDYQLQVQERGLNEAQTRSVNAELASRKAQEEAGAADKKANRAINDSNYAIGKANKAVTDADYARGRADAATEKANRAITKSDGVGAKLDKELVSIDKGVRAVHADLLNRLGIVVIGLTSGLNGAIREYLGLDDRQEAAISSIESKANKAVDDANFATGKADAATDKANRAIREANEAKTIANAQTDKANTAIAKATSAEITSQGAISVASIAISNSQTALSNSQKPLQSISVSQAATNVQKQFDDINASVQTRLGQAQRDFQTTASGIRRDFETTANGFRQQIGNLTNNVQQPNLITDSRIESVIQKSPTVQDLVNQITNNSTNVFSLNNTVTILGNGSSNTQSLVNNLRNRLNIQEQVNNQGLQILRQVQSRVGNLPNAVQTAIAPSLLTVSDVIGAAANGVCQETLPNGCLGSPLGNLGSLLGDIVGSLLPELIAQVGQGQTDIEAVLNEILNRIDQLENGGGGGTGTPSETDLSEIITKLERLSTIVGVDEYPASLPASLISTDAPAAANVSLANLTQLLGWYIQRFDEVMGQWEIPIEIKDSDPTTPGDQPTKIKLPNFAEYAAENYLLSFQNSIDIQTLVNIATRTMLETGQDKQQNYISYRLLQSLVDWAGYKVKEDKEELPMLFTPGKTSFEELLKETKVNVPVVEYDEKHSLEADLMRFRKAASILDALHYKKVDPFSDIKTQLMKSLKDKLSVSKQLNDNDDKVFEKFIEDVQKGFADQAGIDSPTEPYGREFTQRPKIRDLTNFEPPTQP